MELKKIHLGKLLIDKHLVTQEQLDIAIARQSSSGERLGKVLINLGFIREDKLLELISNQLEIPYVDVKNYSFDPEVVHLLPEIYARRFRAILLNNDKNGLLVGMADPQDIVAYDGLVDFFKKPINIALVREEDLLKILDVMYRRTSEITSLAGELSSELVTHEFDVSQLATGLSSADATVAKLLQSIFEDAVQINASDVHIEPDEKVLRIRQRIDGVLHEQILKEKAVAQALALRLKLIAGLNISEKRIPQDGRFSIKIRNINFDVRLSTLPVQFGESIVMRLLNQSAGILDLERIGLPESYLIRLRNIISLPNGLLLITGPTGSGKTTTLYGALTELNTSEKKIITVEDPVEYRINRINQVQVQPKIDLSFARVLRSILRQDPDIIMIGELRDTETASIAMRASMTGHFVLSTLHTNDAVSSAIRLLDMGIEGYIVATVLRAILAQRLVRRICENCKEEYKVPTHEKVWVSHLLGSFPEQIKFQRGTGCTYCYNTGYKGQIGVFELLELNTLLADALRNNDTAKFTKIANENKDFRPLALNAYDFAVSGITSISEVMRVGGETIETTIHKNKPFTQSIEVG